MWYYSKYLSIFPSSIINSTYGCFMVHLKRKCSFTTLRQLRLCEMRASRNFRFSLTFNSNLFFSCGSSCSSNISSSTALALRINNFDANKQSENSFHYNVFKTNPVYSATTEQFDVQLLLHESVTYDDYITIINKECWSEESTDTILDCFRKTAVYSAKINLPLSNPVYSHISKTLAHKCTEMSDEQIVEVFRYLRVLPPTDGVTADNFVTVWKALDAVCLSRLNNWDTAKLLYMMDMWYTLRLQTWCDFVMKAGFKILKKPSRLTSPQLVQIMFNINLLRKMWNKVKLYDIQYQLEKCISDMTLEEIGVVSIGFFKSQTQIKLDNVLEYIVRKLITKMDTVHNITLTAILKVVRYSMPIERVHLIADMLARLEGQIERLSIVTCAHVALLGTTRCFFNRGVLFKVAERFLREPHKARIKDMEKILFAMMLFNFNPGTEPCFFTTVSAEILRAERAEELALYRKSLLNILCYLAAFNIFPDRLITNVLEADSVQVFGNKHSSPRELVLLDCTVELEHPEYTGSRLTRKTRISVAKRYSIYQPDPAYGTVTKYGLLFMEVISLVEEILGGKEKFHTHWFLPHHPRADIAYCIDKDGKLVDIPDEMRSHEPLSGFSWAPTSQGEWRCLVVAGRNQLVHNTREPLGELAQKLRQLQIIGYKPVMVPWFKWEKMESTASKNEYLRKAMFQ